MVDPLVPAGREPSFWAAMDGLVGRHGPRVAVVTTIQWHRRSRDAFVARYDATTSRAKDALPDGVRPVPVRRGGEVMVWLEEHGALVPGDRLIGDGAGGVRLCPPSWLNYLRTKITVAELRDALAPVRDLPVEMVLVSHGDPVLRDGADGDRARARGRGVARRPAGSTNDRPQVRARRRRVPRACPVPPSAPSRRSPPSSPSR